MCSPFCKPNRLSAYRKRDWFFWFDEKPWKDLRTDSRRVARASSSDFLDALVAFRTFDSFFTHHVLFIDGAQRNSSDFGLNFFEPKIIEISLLNFFFHITWKSGFSPSLPQNLIAWFSRKRWDSFQKKIFVGFPVNQIPEIKWEDHAPHDYKDD